MVGSFLLIGMSLASIAALMVLSFLAFELFDGARQRHSYTEILPESDDDAEYRILAETLWSAGTEIKDCDEDYGTLLSDFMIADADRRILAHDLNELQEGFDSLIQAYIDECNRADEMESDLDAIFNG